MSGLTGRRVLVVGGSAGIGRAVVVAGAAAGAELVVVGRDRAKLDEVHRTTGAAPISADVSDPEQCRELVAESVRRLGGLDVVVISSALSSLALLDDESPQRWTDVLATNVVGPSVITSAALEHLSESGLIIYLSSTSSRADNGTHAGLGAYAASKAALNRTVDGWRAEHPDRRFVCMRVGDTGGTDVARNFDPEAAASLFGRWLVAGLVAETVMDPGELGSMIVGVAATLLDHPGLTVPDLEVRPVGGAMKPDGLGGLLEDVQLAAKSEGGA